MVTFDPTRPDFSPYGLSCVRWTPTPMRRPDHHNEIELNMLPKGWVTYLFGGRKVRIEAGQLSVFWAAIPHQILDYEAGTPYFVATVPFAWFLQCRLPERFVQPLLHGEVQTERLSPGQARHDVDLFTQWEADLSKPGDEVRHVVMLEVEARLRRLLARLPAAPTSAAGPKTRSRATGLHGGELNKVEQIACFIARRYTEPLTVTEIGKEVGLHPNYAMGLFKKTFGTTLWDPLESTCRHASLSIL